MQRRVEQPHRDRQAVHRFEDLDEVGLLHDAQLLERCRFVLVRPGQDHPANDRQAVLAEEHVLGTAQADALGTEPTGVRGVGPVVGVGTHGELALADLVGPSEQLVELGRRLRLGERSSAEDDLTGRAVEGDEVAFAHDDLADSEAVPADSQGLGADNRGDAPSTSHDRGMAHEPSPRGEDALAHTHAVHVFGRGLLSDQDHLLAALGGVGRSVGSEVGLADRCTRRGRQAGGDDLEVASTRTAGAAPDRGGRR